MTRAANEKPPRAGLAARVFDGLMRGRWFALGGLACVLLAGLWSNQRLRLDMSFRPTFTEKPEELARTAEHERTFGQVGFRDLLALANVGDASDPKALERLAELARRVRKIPAVVEVRDPLSFPFFDHEGILHALGLSSSLAAGSDLRSASARSLIADLLRSPSARRLVVGDGARELALTAAIDIPNQDFARRREVVARFRRVVQDWSKETGIPCQVTGYPEVEQVYAEEVLASVFRSIGLLVAMMVAILFLYFRRLTDVVTCLSGVTLALPLILGLMALLGQPFSIVNSQVLTLVLIVGIGQALHHQEEYRRRREAGRDHTAANREAFAILAWPSFMTGLATIAGFAALTSADMKAIWSFGLCTALGVALVYALNWLVVPLLIQTFYRAEPARNFLHQPRSWTLEVVRHANQLLQARPRLVVGGFFLATLGLLAAGASGLSVDQKVNEELPATHPARLAEATYEREFAGFLGPELALRPKSGDLAHVAPELTQFVNRVCAMPEVRYVASPLDFLPQSPVSNTGKACLRQGGDLTRAVAARGGQAGPALQTLATGLISANGEEGAVVVRVADLGTAKTLPFVERLRALARETMPDVAVEPVGQWWLAQQGMNRLSFDVMLSACTALLVILPLMFFAIRDLKLFLAAIPPTVLPVLATLGFMGLTHITVRIGTAMILAIALGLAADDTIHLSVRIRDRRRSGSDPDSAVSATLLRTGRPCSFSSYVLIGGFASMMVSSLLALRAMGLIATFSMAFALATDVVLGPALYLLLERKRAPEARASLRDLLLSAVARHPERPAVSYRLPLGNDGSPELAPERSLSWHETAQVVLDTARLLDVVLGPARVVAVFSDTDARYPVLELALGLSGRVVQPLYVESADAELRRALALGGAEALVVGRSQLERARAAEFAPAFVELEQLVRLPGSYGAPHAALSPDVEPFDTRSVRAELNALPTRSPAAALLYLQSTGTTGPARVLEISEAALMHAVHTVEGEASQRFPRFLSFLPTAHISERLLTLYLSLALAGHTVYGGGLATLERDLRACRPTAFLAPPLLFETIRRGASAEANASAVGRFLLARVERSANALLASGVVGGARRSWAAWLFGRTLKRALGLDQVRDALSGTAPMPGELHAWCEAVGLSLRIVYGQTEVAGATTITARTGARFGSVGRPVRDVELCTSEDGELLVRSGAAFTRYVQGSEQATPNLERAWLHSGDRATLLPSGELVLLGRTQSLFTTASGARVDTAPIAEAIRKALGDSDIAFQPLATEPALHVYVAVHRAGAEPLVSAPLTPILETDPRAQQLTEALLAADPERALCSVALFSGAFDQATGEVGPTGKLRAWRIHELRASTLRELRRPVARPQGAQMRRALPG